MVEDTGEVLKVTWFLYNSDRSPPSLILFVAFTDRILSSSHGEKDVWLGNLRL